MRRERGLTLVEVLVVVSILGLLFGVLLIYFLGGDDRRCKLEAERIAVYMQETAAEAVMADGPMRVAVDLEAQKLTRERGRIGADVNKKMFEPDDRKKPLDVRKPVKATALITQTGERTEGTGWVAFAGRRTEGAVVVLELNEAVYSVIVPPGQDLPPRVQQGRANLPEPPGSGPRRPPVLPGRLWAVGDGGLPSNLGDGESPGTQPVNVDGLDPGAPVLPQVDAGGGSDNPGQDPDDLDAGLPPADAGVAVDAGAPNLPYDAGETDGPSAEDAAADAGEQDAGAGEGCTTDEQCEGSELLPGYCAEDNVCATYPVAGAAFVLDGVTLRKPDDNFMRPLVENALNEEISAGNINIFVFFPPKPLSFLRQKPHSYGPNFYVGFAAVAEAGYVAHQSLPSYSVQGVSRTHECDNEAILQATPFCAWVDLQSGERNYGFGRQLTLYLPDASKVGNCQYEAIAVAANLYAALDHSGRGTVLINGAITKDSAQRIRIPGSNQTLEELLDSAGVNKEAFTDNFPSPDAYAFDFVGTGDLVPVSGNIIARADYPSPCDD